MLAFILKDSHGPDGHGSHGHLYLSSSGKPSISLSIVRGKDGPEPIKEWCCTGRYEPEGDEMLRDEVNWDS